MSKKRKLIKLASFDHVPWPTIGKIRDSVPDKEVLIEALVRVVAGGAKTVLIESFTKKQMKILGEVISRFPEVCAILRGSANVCLLRRDALDELGKQLRSTFALQGVDNNTYARQLGTLLSYLHPWGCVPHRHNLHMVSWFIPGRYLMHSTDLAQADVVLYGEMIDITHADKQVLDARAQQLTKALQTTNERCHERLSHTATVEYVLNIRDDAATWYEPIAQINPLFPSHTILLIIHYIGILHYFN